MPSWEKKINLLRTLVPFILIPFLLVLPTCSSSEPEKLYSQGEEAWHRGEYSLAIGHFEKLMELYPKHALADDTLMWIGDIHYLFLSRYDEAVMYYRDLVNLYPDSPRRVEARMKLAAIYRGKKNDCKMAIIEYGKIISDDVPFSVAAEAQHRIAMCHFQSGDIQQARTEFEILVADYPESEYVDDALYGLASCYYAQRRCQEAVRFYEKVVDISRDDNLVADSRFGIAACFEERGRLREALEAFRDLLEFYPNRRVVEQRLRKIEDRIQTMGEKRNQEISPVLPRGNSAEIGC